METEDLSSAAQQIAVGLDLDSGRAELQLLRAMLAQQVGDVTAAHEAFAVALDADPTLASAWSNRAILWFEQGLVERAIDDLSRALELDDDPDIRANRAIAYEAAGRFSEAAADRELVAAAAA